MMRATLIPWLCLVDLCAFVVCVRDPPPAAGWCKTKGCKTKDNNRKPAQSGLDGYCKICFRKKFPAQHSAMQQRRFKVCSICEESKDLTAEGICKPCKKTRSCESCSLVNLDKSAVACAHCAEARKKQGATKDRLAMWCSTCYDDEQRASGRCFTCHRKSIGKCGHCERENAQIASVRKCADADCNVEIRLCSSCVGPFRSYDNL